jgi:hypothetical protein
MDETNTGKAATGTTKRPWVCEIETAGTWGPYGGHFGTLAGVRRSWALQSTWWPAGTAPAARARNITTGEIVAL